MTFILKYFYITWIWKCPAVFPENASFIFFIDDSSFEGVSKVPRFMDPEPIPIIDDLLEVLGGDGDDKKAFSWNKKGKEIIN